MMSVEDDHWVIPAAAMAQPIVFDADGSLRPSLLGFRLPAASGDAVLMAWINQGSHLDMSVDDPCVIKGSFLLPQTKPTPAIS